VIVAKKLADIPAIFANWRPDKRCSYMSSTTRAAKGESGFSTRDNSVTAAPFILLAPRAM
jgi:hypothetical protein